MFLTRAELADLTGYHLPAWQIRWLVAHDWRFERSATGRPVVLRAHAESRMSDPGRVAPAVTMNLDIIRKRA